MTVRPLPDLEPRFELLAKGPGYHFALWREIYVLDFRGTVTIEAVDAAVAGTARARQRNPGGFFTLNLLYANVELPTREVREYAAVHQNDDNEGCVLHATVVHGTGFTAAAMRSALVGLSLVSRHRMVRRVFGTNDAAIDWFAAEKRLPPAWRADAGRGVAAICAAT